MNDVIELIRQLARDRFYGALTLKFESGRVVIIKKEETIKPLELPEQPGKRKHGQQDESQNEQDSSSR